jgi:hypothetical protein
VILLKDASGASHLTGPIRRLLDPTQPFLREDVLWALDYVRRKAAEKARQPASPDQMPCCEYFACFAEMALLLLNRQMPGPPEQARFRAMLADLHAGRGL